MHGPAPTPFEEPEMTRKAMRPGSPAPDSGIVRTTSGDRATVVRGRPLPPTPKPGAGWRFERRTDPKHEPGR